MGQSTSRRNIKDGIKKFYQQLPEFGLEELRLIYEYFRSDLIYSVDSMDTISINSLFKELASRNVLFDEKYAEMKQDLGHFEFSEKLVEDILDAGREAVIGFWESLFELEFESSNLHILLEEIHIFGDTLMQQILCDKDGHSLSPELKDMQEHHKQHLLHKTQYLEDKYPGTLQEKEKIYISECYMDIITGLSEHSQHWLQESGGKHEAYRHNLRNNRKYISIDKLFRWSWSLRCQPHVVLVTGAPGVGKTTLINKFVCDWVNRKFYQRFSFIFFFKFRELNRLEEVSLESLILQEYPHLQTQLENILQDPDKLLFVFDGLDESIHQMDFKVKSELCHSTKESRNLGVIVVNLVRQSLLKGCSVLVTSRTTKLSSVNTKGFQQVTEIMGFLPQVRLMYCEHIFKDKELSDECFHYMQINGPIYTFSYIPFYCQAICRVYKFVKDQSTIYNQVTPLPKTLTQLFATFVVSILSNHNQDKEGTLELLTSIGRLAEYGLWNHIVAFSEQDLASFNVNTSSTLLYSLMIKSDQPSNTTFSFLHVTIQEFLASLVHYISDCPEKLHKSFEEIKSHKDHYGDIFLCFLCGLTDHYTRFILNPYLGELSFRTAKDIIPYLQQTITDAENNDDDNFDFDFGYDEKETERKRRLLNVFFYLFETQNKVLVLESLGKSRNVDFSCVLLTPLDCTVLSFILESCGETENLCLSQCKVQVESMQILSPVLHTVKDIRLNGSFLYHDGVRYLCESLNRPDCRTQSLSLANSQLTDMSCSHLGNAIRCNQTLETLILSYNKLEGPNFSDLLIALTSPTCRIQELDLTHTGLKDCSCVQLASAITNNQSLRILYLSCNDLTGPHFGHLITALSSPLCLIEQLMLQYIILTDEYCPLLVSLSNNTNLTQLELSNNRITDDGASYIEELIQKSHSLQEISLYSNNRMTQPVRQRLINLRDHKTNFNVFID